MPKSEQTNIQPMFNHLFELPSLEERTVLGMWKSVEPLTDMTRTIEQVSNKYYIVARFVDERGIRSGGTNGIELRRISATKYLGVPPNRSTYLITPAGELHMFTEGETVPSMRAVPHSQVWAR